MVVIFSNTKYLEESLKGSPQHTTGKHFKRIQSLSFLFSGVFQQGSFQKQEIFPNYLERKQAGSGESPLQPRGAG